VARAVGIYGRSPFAEKCNIAISTLMKACVDCMYRLLCVERGVDSQLMVLQTKQPCDVDVNKRFIHCHTEAVDVQMYKLI